MLHRGPGHEHIEASVGKRQLRGVAADKAGALDGAIEALQYELRQPANGRAASSAANRGEMEVHTLSQRPDRE
jgi:hypothetical protein